MTSTPVPATPSSSQKSRLNFQLRDALAREAALMAMAKARQPAPTTTAPTTTAKVEIMEDRAAPGDQHDATGLRQIAGAVGQDIGMMVRMTFWMLLNVLHFLLL